MSKLVQLKAAGVENGSFAENLSRSIPSEVLGPYIALDQAIYAAMGSDPKLKSSAQNVLWVATGISIVALFWLYAKVYAKAGQSWTLSAIIATVNFFIWTYVAGHVWHLSDTPNPIYAAGLAFLSTMIPLFLTGLTPKE